MESPWDLRGRDGKQRVSGVGGRRFSGLSADSSRPEGWGCYPIPLHYPPFIPGEPRRAYRMVQNTDLSPQLFHVLLPLPMEFETATRADFPGILPSDNFPRTEMQAPAYRRLRLFNST